jgi:hypothetical protein
MRRMALLLAVLGACGGDGTSAERVLARTTDALTEVRRGNLHLRVTASTLADPQREVGFEVRGPFALSEAEGRLPEVRFTYTELRGERSETATFVSTGDRAFVERGGRAVPVPEETLTRFRGRADPEKAAALGRLELDEWAESPRRTGDRVVAEVDVPHALNDVFGLAASVGADPEAAFPRIEGEDAEHLRRAVSRSRMEVVADEDGYRFRSLRLVVDFSPRDQQRLEQLLGRFGGARLSVTIDLS